MKAWDAIKAAVQQGKDEAWGEDLTLRETMKLSRSEVKEHNEKMKAEREAAKGRHPSGRFGRVCPDDAREVTGE